METNNLTKVVVIEAPSEVGAAVKGAALSAVGEGADLTVLTLLLSKIMWLNSIMVGWLMYDCGAYQLYPKLLFKRRNCSLPIGAIPKKYISYLLYLIKRPLHTLLTSPYEATSAEIRTPDI